MKYEGGFTLIELMIVILIIAILVAIAIPVYISIQNGANQNTAKANMRTVDGAIQAYRAYWGAQQDPATADLVPTFLKKWPDGPNGFVYSIDAGGSCSCTGIVGY
jgi:prepilin-type N-terminal cleavage/methylation domain-containing protein